MKTSFLTTGVIALVLTVILSYLFVVLIAAGFRKKYHPNNSINLAQGLVLAGKLLCSMILISGIFAPMRDYLFVSSTAISLNSIASWSFIFICCGIISITYVLASAFESFLSHQIFKGQGLAIELQENNLAVAIVRVAVITALAFALLFSMSTFMQAFIPVPSIPTIR